MSPTTVSPSRAKRLEARRKNLGVSYLELGRRTGKSHTVVQRVLKEQEGEFAINRDQVMDRIAIALADVKEEQERTKRLLAEEKDQ